MKTKPINNAIIFSVSGMPKGIVRQFRPDFAYMKPSALRELFIDTLVDYNGSLDVSIGVFQGNITTWSDQAIQSFLLSLKEDDEIRIEIINPTTI